ncbi:MAG: hypothetical protein J6P96_02120, partial [Bacteroidaceae bacterium]|nr:hypothetical protein [Bacteroidaceae bacterium]
LVNRLLISGSFISRLFIAGIDGGFGFGGGSYGSSSFRLSGTADGAEPAVIVKQSFTVDTNHFLSS